MKRWILKLCLIAICMGFFSSTAYGVSFELNLLDSFIEKGETFQVEVIARDARINEDLLGFGFNVIEPGRPQRSSKRRV